VEHDSDKQDYSKNVKLMMVMHDVMRGKVKGIRLLVKVLGSKTC
jgi:hypothetical protein